MVCLRDIVHACEELTFCEVKQTSYNEYSRVTGCESQRGNQGGDEGPVGKESHLKPLEVGLHQDF